MNTIITGSPRSGTSALCNLCSFIDGVFITNEMAFFHWWNRHDSNFLLNNLHNASSSIHTFFQIRELDSIKWLNMCLQNQYTGYQCLESLKVLTNSQVVGDKYPAYLHDIGEVDSNIDKIFLTIRDPRAIIASRLRPYLNSHQRWNVSSIKEAEDLWLRDFKPLLKLIQDQRTSVFTYELCVYDPVSTAITISLVLERPCKFIANSSHLYVPTHVDSWKTEFNDMNSMLSNETLDSIRRLGYAL